ncbi:MAG: hypothetical protein OXC61_11795 [Flavobacteriaceae bacterium]|nr:hypothetical protein [Flavobacteriaceae bacterium]
MYEVPDNGQTSCVHSGPNNAIDKLNNNRQDASFTKTLDLVNMMGSNPTYNGSLNLSPPLAQVAL